MTLFTAGPDPADGRAPAGLRADRAAPDRDVLPPWFQGSASERVVAAIPALPETDRGTARAARPPPVERLARSGAEAMQPTRTFIRARFLPLLVGLLLQPSLAAGQ